MPGHAFDLDDEAVGTVDGGDDADRQSLGFEHGPLLDVEFGVGEDIGALPDGVAGALGVESEGGQCVAHRHAVPVAAVEELPVEGSGHRPAPEQGRAEAHAFLVGEAHDLDRERQPRTRALSVCTQSMAATTPSMPSYLPALRTVSRCEPSIRQGAPGARPS